MVLNNQIRQIILIRPIRQMEIRTRFAPSPTGYLHIGHLRTALYSYALAQSQGGKMILRVEDTDRNRYVPGSIEKIYEMLKLFGITWDEGPLIGGPHEPYVQSERVKAGLYKKYADKLLSDGHAYYCFCKKQTSEEIREEHLQKKITLRDPCRELIQKEIDEKIASGLIPAVRLKVPEHEKVSYHDFVIKKEISWDTSYIDEVMLYKSDGYPTYHLGVVVDDSLMEITHITRGPEWLPSVPVHLLLYKYLGFEVPQIGHLTAILDPAGGKLSKRKGSVSCQEFLNEGYLPEALLNFIMLLGWAPKDNREIFNLIDFIEEYPKGNLQVSNSVFDRKKLDWFNGFYIRQKSDSELVELLKPFVPEGGDQAILYKIVPLVKDRLVKLSDLSSFAGFFFTRPKVNPALFGSLDYKKHLGGALSNLSNLTNSTNWTNENISNSLTSLIAQNGWKTGDFYMSFRIALTGSKFTPPITESAVILGKEEVISRLASVL